jgi:hypothetical protein
MMKQIITKQIEQSKLVNQHFSLVLMIQLNYVVHVVILFINEANVTFEVFLN